MSKLHKKRKIKEISSIILLISGALSSVTGFVSIILNIIDRFNHKTLTLQEKKFYSLGKSVGIERRSFESIPLSLQVQHSNTLIYYIILTIVGIFIIFISMKLRKKAQ